MIQKKKVFLLLPRLCYGGQERFVSRLSEMLNESYDVYVLVFDSTDRVYEASGKLLDLKAPVDLKQTRVKKIITWGKAIRQYRKLLRSIKPQASFSFGMQADLLNVISKWSEVKTYVSIRGFLTAENICNSSRYSKLYKRADGIVCVSKEIENYIYENINISKNKLFTIYNGIDLQKIEINAVKKSTFVRVADVEIIAAGSLKYEKGYWHLIKAIYLLKEKMDIHLNIIGNDYKGHGEKLRVLIEELCVEGNVSLLGWQENPFVYFQHADIFVLSSVREGFPNVLIEAMACGLPVIASDCHSGPREILLDENTLHGECGILIPELNSIEDFSENIDEGDRKLAEAIEIIARDKNLLAKYSAKSKKRAEYFSYDNCMKRYSELIEAANTV